MDAITDNYQLIAISFAATILLFVFSAVGSLVLGALLVTLRVGPVAVMRTQPPPPTSPSCATRRC